MTIIEAISLGLIQGLTEFIPVSSSGHLIAGHELFGTSESTLVFDVALHIGTLLALIIFFWRDLLGLARNVFAKNHQGKFARVVAVATVPAVIAGFTLADWLDKTLRKPEVVVVTMTVMAMAMLIAEKLANKRRTTNDVNQNDGLVVGVAQALALVPGVSRSGATITMGLLRGLKRSEAARLSFIMAVPITAGAILGSILGAESGELTGQANVLAIGILVSLLSGLFAIRFLMKFLSGHSLKVFAYYRLVFAVLLAGFLMLR